MPQSVVSLLIFELDDQRFGIAMAEVQEIVRAVSFARLPKAPRIIEGVVNFRDTAVPLLDIRARFRLPPKAIAPSDHFIIAWAESRTVAIRVDRVIDLMPVALDDIEDIKNITSESEYIAGVAKLPDDTVLIHELASFLTAAEAAELDATREHIPS